MAEYDYVALDKHGKKHKGTIQAESMQRVKKALIDKQFIPIQINEHILRTQYKTVRAYFRRTKQRSSAKQIGLFTRQLATLLQSNVPVADALQTLVCQNENSPIKRLAQKIRLKVLEGYSLANALRVEPKSFNEIYCATIAAGESSGSLPLVLDRLADYLERQQQLRRKILSAMLYPGIITLTAIGIVAFLLTHVVPQILTVFADSGQSLPWITQLLLWISHGVNSYGLWLLLAGVLGIVVFSYMKQQPALEHKIHSGLLQIPVIKQVAKSANITRFAYTFSILTEAGVPVHESMQIATKLIGNTAMRRRLESAVKQVREGGSIHLALSQTQLVPALSLQLIANGESSGDLSAALARAASQQDQELQYYIDIALTLFEPMMILVMGFIVLFIVMAILLPIFSIEQVSL